MIIAHRGASGISPENTMIAFELAYEQGAQAIELDVHLTKDLIPVVIHDETVNRTTNGHGFIKELTLREIRLLDAGYWYDPQFAGARIPTLNEVLLWAKSRNIIINLELKTNKIHYVDIEQIIYNQVASYQMLEKTIFSSFNSESLKLLFNIDNRLDLALITSKRCSHKKLDNLVRELRINAVHFKYPLLNKRFLELLKNFQLKARVFTVNKPAHLLKSYSFGVDGVITDFPKKAKYILKELP